MITFTSIRTTMESTVDLMRIVKPNSPESMSVIVDTIFSEKHVIWLAPSHPAMDRVDIIYTKPMRLGLYINVAIGPAVNDGTKSWEWPLPALPEGARAVAKIYIHRAQTAIFDSNIVEME